MSNKRVIVRISDAECVITLKRKGPKAVISYRDMMAVFTLHKAPVYRGRHGSQVSNDVIDQFLNEGQHPHIEFHNNKKLTVSMCGYQSVEIDFDQIDNEEHYDSEMLAQIEVPTTAKIIISGGIVLISCLSLWRLAYPA